MSERDAVYLENLALIIEANQVRGVIGDRPTVVALQEIAGRIRERTALPAQPVSAPSGQTEHMDDREAVGLAIEILEHQGFARLAAAIRRTGAPSNMSRPSVSVEPGTMREKT